ncbi:MAG: branched-chain amino acid ABC transporter permease [Proteobacteria bacterium]|nr:branched-chain amino acid ABC transporter permease [Pseudomonadota bacterium]MBU1742039.1 branched-chain amino acid ABC transporter permease [Pseudomonadota bacterium]
MEKIVPYLIVGLSQGSLYALVAIGIVVIYRASRVLNFAHGDMATAGAFIAFGLLALNLPWWLGFAIALLIGGLISVVFYFGVLIPAQRRESTHLGQIMLTLGFGLVIQGLIVRFGGTEPKRFNFPLTDIGTEALFSIGGMPITPFDLGALVVGVLGSLLFYLLVQKTPLGLAMRATSENLPAAQTLGIPTRRVLAFSWGMAAVLAVLAGFFMAKKFELDPVFMLEPFLKGFAAAILGGLNSLPGAIVGGLVLGLVENMAAYVSTLSDFLEPLAAFRQSLAFLLIILMLLVRPEGLLGKEFVERV